MKLRFFCLRKHYFAPRPQRPQAKLLSEVKFPDKCRDRIHSRQTTKENLSSTQTYPRPVNALVVGYVDGEAQEEHIFSLGLNTPENFRLKYMPLILF
jgi:hypothetical protein